MVGGGRPRVRASYHPPDDRREHVRDAVASVFGRAGLAVADRLG